VHFKEAIQRFVGERIEAVGRCTEAGTEASCHCRAEAAGVRATEIGSGRWRPYELQKSVDLVLALALRRSRCNKHRRPGPGWAQGVGSIVPGFDEGGDVARAAPASARQGGADEPRALQGASRRRVEGPLVPPRAG